MIGRIFKKTWLYTLTWLLGRVVYRLLFRWELFNVENMPKDGPCIIASTHASFIDPPIVGTALPRPIEYMGRKTLFTGNRFLAWLIIQLGTFPIDRDGDSRAAIRAFCERLDSGLCVLMFPEGTRTRDGRIGEMKPGIGMIATRSHAPVLPIYLDGTYNVWPRHKKFLRPSKIRVYAGELITPRDTGTDRAAAKEEQQRIHNEVEHQLRDLEARFGPGGSERPPDGIIPNGWAPLAIVTLILAALCFFFFRSSSDTGTICATPIVKNYVEEMLHTDSAFLWRITLLSDAPAYNAFFEISQPPTMQEEDQGIIRTWHPLADFQIPKNLSLDRPYDATKPPFPIGDCFQKPFRIGFTIHHPELSALSKTEMASEAKQASEYATLKNTIDYFAQYDEKNPVPEMLAHLRVYGVMLNIVEVNKSFSYSRVRLPAEGSSFDSNKSIILWEQDINDGTGWQAVRLRLAPADQVQAAPEKRLTTNSTSSATTVDSDTKGDSATTNTRDSQIVPKDNTGTNEELLFSKSSTITNISESSDTSKDADIKATAVDASKH